MTTLHVQWLGDQAIVPRAELEQLVELARRSETVEVTEQAVAGPVTPGDFQSLPFFGMWRDRPDVSDSAEWVRKERQQWQHRQARPD